MVTNGAPSWGVVCMDSLTQAVLGATVGYAIGGRQLGRKAALWGMGLGTLPDLDVLVRYSDPIDSFVMHRSWSHSLILTGLVSVPIGLLISRLHKASRAVPVRMIMMAWLILLTHILLDALTSYGTQIFWGLTNWIPSLPQAPVGVASVSIIDPLYTLPLLIATIWILVRGRVRPDGQETLSGKVTFIALFLSTLYLGWGMVAQYQVEQKVRVQMAAEGKEIDSLYVTPTFGNSVLWYVMVREGDKVHFGLRSLLEADDAPISLTTQERRTDLLASLPNQHKAQQVMTFSHGFYRFLEADRQIYIADMRMGYPPHFGFNFALAERVEGGDGPVALTPTKQVRGQLDGRLFGFLWQRMFDPTVSLPY